MFGFRSNNAHPAQFMQLDKRTALAPDAGRSKAQKNRPQIASSIPRFLFLILSAVAPSALHAALSPNMPPEARDFVTSATIRFNALQEKWSAESDPAKKKEMRTPLLRLALESMQSGPVIENITAGGRLNEMEIKIDMPAENVPLAALKTFDSIQNPGPESGGKWVARRITPNAFEIWTPTEGWLFDAKGALLNHAGVPRRDGHGREWFGAFLPDGRWATTDLWEMDRTFTIFTRDGRWLKEFPAEKLLPPIPNDPLAFMRTDLIAWARSDAEGRGWIASIGSEGGRGVVRVGPDGHARRLEDGEPWELTYPRALGPRGFYIHLQLPNDGASRWLVRYAAGHGMWVETPYYRVQDSPEGLDWNMDLGWPILKGSSNFGVWPDSDQFFLGARDKTWFGSEKDGLLAWIGAVRNSDSNAGSMLFVDAQGRAIDLTPKLNVASVKRFLLENEPARPELLLDDLKLGFFTLDRQLILASWD